MTKKENKFAISVLFGLLPLINVYSIYEDKFTFGHLIMAITLFLFSVKPLPLKSKKIWRPYLVLVFYSIALTLLICLTNSYDLKTPVIRIVLLFFYFVTLVRVGENIIIDWSIFINVYKKLAVIAAVGVLFQYGARFFLGREIFLLIPGLNYSQSTLSNYQVYVANYTARTARGAFTPTSLFLEPTQASMIMSPSVALLLNDNYEQSKGRYIWALLISIACILTRAGEAVLLIGFIWGWFLLDLIRRGKIKGVRFYVLILIIIIMTAAFGQTVYTMIIARSGALLRGEGSSATQHLTKGYLFFKQLPPINKVFGIGWGNYMSFIKTHKVIGSMHAFEYMNSFSYVLNSTGIIGISLFIHYLTELFLKAKHNGSLVLFFIFLLVYLSESVFYTIDGMFLTLLIFLPINYLDNKPKRGDK